MVKSKVLSKTVIVNNKKSRRRRSGRRKPRFALFPKLPSSMKVSLRARTYETGSSTASPVWNRYGLVEFLSRGGRYTDSLYGLYNFAVVHGCRITVRVVNVGSEPIMACIAPLPHDWVGGSPTLSEIIDTPRSVRGTTGGNSGIDRLVLNNACTAREALGKDYQVARYQMDATQAVSTTPLVSSEPCWVVALSAFNASTAISYRLEIELEWNVEFYNLTSV